MHKNSALYVNWWFYASTRYAYSSVDAEEELYKDDTLKLIKPSTVIPKDVRSSESDSPTSGNASPQSDLEEEKND